MFLALNLLLHERILRHNLLEFESGRLRTNANALPPISIRYRYRVAREERQFGCVVVVCIRYAAPLRISFYPPLVIESHPIVFEHYSKSCFSELDHDGSVTSQLWRYKGWYIILAFRYWLMVWFGLVWFENGLSVEHSYLFQSVVHR